MTTVKEKTEETVKISYLNNNGAAVKKIFVRATKSTIARAKDLIEEYLNKAKGTLMYYRKLSENEFFAILSFEDPVMLIVWEAITSTELGKIQEKDEKIEMNDAERTKVLIVEDKAGSDHRAMKKMEKIKAALISDYKAAVLQEDKLEEAKYRLLLLFAKKRKMKEFERTFDVQNS